VWQRQHGDADQIHREQPLSAGSGPRRGDQHQADDDEPADGHRRRVAGEFPECAAESTRRERRPSAESADTAAGTPWRFVGMHVSTPGGTR